MTTRRARTTTPRQQQQQRRLLRGWDADCIGSAGTYGAAGGGAEGFVEADFYGGEVVIAATQSHAGGRDGGVGGGEEVDDLGGWHGDLVVERGELGWDGDAVVGRAGEGEEVVGGEAGAGAVGLPFVAEESGVGVDVAVLGGVAGAWGGGAVLWVGAVEVLGPEAVEDEGWVLGALGCVGVGVAVFG